ncbi:MAG: copper-binding protein [Anaerolineae bacterium]|nr:copper-binding protein [Anaerolineae bacterium]
MSIARSPLFRPGLTSLLLLGGSLLALSTVPIAASAQSAKPAAPAASATADMAEGVVRHVDREAGRIMLRHGEIKSINMPPMTMLFHVRDRALLDGVNAGAKVRFAVVAEDGKHVITHMTLAE